MAPALLGALERAHAWRPERTRIMGIVNVTPDSFSDGGLFAGADAAIEHGCRLVREGADLLDIGGESTRPGAAPVSEEEELERVLPVLQGLRSAVSVPLSIDTMKASVAAAAIEAGATWVNDVSGGLHDPGILEVAARAEATYVAMHRSGDSRTMQVAPKYVDCVAEVAEHLRGRAEQALVAGIRPDHLLLDPGIGFGKRLEDNLALLRNLSELRSIGAPLLVGPSRKAFIGQLQGSERPDAWRTGERQDTPADRVGGTAAAVAACVEAGVAVVRVHDVAVMAQCALVAHELLSWERGGNTPSHRAN